MSQRSPEWRTSLERVRTYARALVKDDAIGRLVETVQKSGEPYLFGGAPRDVVFSGRRVVGDIDIFVSGRFDPESIDSLVRQSRRTNFGGYRLLVGRHDVDIWELPASYAFAVNKGLEVSIPQLLKTVCFSTDAIAVSLETRKVTTSKDFDRSFENRQLSFVNVPANPGILVGVRAARLLIKLGLQPSQEIADFLGREIDKYGIPALIAAEDRWRGRRVLDETSLRYLQKSLGAGKGVATEGAG